jgi:hypothetical protein
MPTAFTWSKETYENSLSSRCWWCTPLDGGQWNDFVAADDELRQIVAMEQELGPVPDWAEEMVAKVFYAVPPCGHYTFPARHLEIISSVGSENPAARLHSRCFAADRNRKREIQDYCLGLDAWLAGASPEPVAAELNALGYRRINWSAVCRDLWQVLGERTETKELLVERTLHEMRYWVKASVWTDDLASEFGRDQYLGDCQVGDCPARIEHNISVSAPAFRQSLSPRLQRMEARLAEICSDWPRFRDLISWWWPCAPKTFRFLERHLWAIGQGSLPEKGEAIPGFLQCEDTYPNQDEAAAWWRQFLDALDGWWQGRPATGEVGADVNQRLAESTPIKRWLVRLFARRIRRLEENGEDFVHFVNPKPTQKRGTRPLNLMDGPR